jgi:DNA-binding protein H-NS
VSDDIKALQAEKQAIEARLAEARKAAREGAIRSILDIMTDHELTGADLGFVKPSRAPRKPRGASGPAKYRDPESGQTWVGRGKRPTWLVNALAQGRTLQSYEVAGQYQ